MIIAMKTVTVLGN